MTQNRLFKNKVKEVAELNGLSYTEAKEAVIAFNKLVEEDSQEEKSEIAEFLENGPDSFNVYSVFPVEYLVYKEKTSKTVMFKSKRSITYNNADRIKLSSRPKPLFLDLSPLHDQASNVGYRNILETQILCSTDENARMVFFSLVEDFGAENSYFVSPENFFSQMPKVIREIEAYDGKEDVLVGIVAPNEKYYTDVMSSNQRRTLYTLFERIVKLMEEKPVCLVTNEERHLERADVTDFMRCPGNAFEWHTEQVKYYPFDKIGGGSHYRSIDKTVLGYVEGVPQFNIAQITLIETDGETCVEKIRKANHSSEKVVVWQDAENPKLYPQMLLKIDSHMDSSMMWDFAAFVFYCFDNRAKIEGMIIESPDAEKMRTLLEQVFSRNKVGKPDSSNTQKPSIENYTLTNGYLYHEELGEISLYKS